jgi:hypothetical protein
VSFKGARNATADAEKRSKEDAKKRAEELAAKAKEPGTDFAALAKESTDEAAGKTSGGDLGFFTKDAMVKEFSDAAFAMQPGQISGVVESPFGFHVIKVEDKKAAVSTTLEQAQKKIAEQLLQKEQRPALAKAEADKVLAALKAGGNAEPEMAAAKVTWQATGELAASSRYLPGVGSSKEVSDAMAAVSKPGELYPQTVDVRGNLFIFRLKTRKDADMSKFDAEKRKEMTASASFSEGYTLFSAYEKEIREQMEKTAKIWMNPEYLALDDKQTSEKGS